MVLLNTQQHHHHRIHTSDMVLHWIQIAMTTGLLVLLSSWKVCAQDQTNANTGTCINETVTCQGRAGRRGKGDTVLHWIRIAMTTWMLVSSSWQVCAQDQTNTNTDLYETATCWGREGGEGKDFMVLHWIQIAMTTGMLVIYYRHGRYVCEIRPMQIQVSVYINETTTCRGEEGDRVLHWTATGSNADAIILCDICAKWTNTYTGIGLYEC